MEPSDRLRVTGFALTLWSNAWIALDAVGVGDSLKAKSTQIQGFRIASENTNQPTSETDANLKDLVETLQRELPPGTIRYSSKVDSIEDSGNFKLIYLSDDSFIKTKVLIGCDGVNSKVAKWLGLQSLARSGRSSLSCIVKYPDGHGFEPKFHTYFGRGVQCGFVPSDETTLYWFRGFSPLFFNYDEDEKSPLVMRKFVISNFQNVPKRVSEVVEMTDLDCISYAPLKFGYPWNVLFGNIAKSNVCVAGDAFHPMPPDIGQGGCSALEDGVILARCLVEALKGKPIGNVGQQEEYLRIENGLKKYVNERRWRAFSVVTTAHVISKIQESDNKLMRLLKKRLLSKLIVGAMSKMADFDCGKFTIS